MPTSSEIGRLIREWRELRGKSQRELAERCGVSVRHLSFIETGRAAPSRDAVAWIAEALALSHAETGLLLEAAGFIAPYAEAGRHDGREDELQRLLELLAPKPAMLHDVFGTIHGYNRAFAVAISSLVSLGDYHGAHDGLRLLVELRTRIVGWEQLTLLYVRRLHDELFRARGATKADLDTQLARMAGALPPELITAAMDRRAELALLTPIEIPLPSGPLRLEATTLTLGTQVHTAVRELRVLVFLPRDAASAALLTELLARPGGAAYHRAPADADR